MVIQQFSRFITLAVIGIALMGCTSLCNKSDWTILIDGDKGLDNFVQVGKANWTATDGAIQASEGVSSAFLATKNTYKDFHLRLEFWTSNDANSGIFIRCQDPKNFTAANCYEVNIFDQRPDPTYGTGAIVDFAKLKAPMIKVGGKWNTYEVIAQGKRMILKINGEVTVDFEDSTLGEGVISLQWGQGVVKFRRLEIKSL